MFYLFYQNKNLIKFLVLRTTIPYQYDYVVVKILFSLTCSFIRCCDIENHGLNLRPNIQYVLQQTTINSMFGP